MFPISSQVCAIRRMASSGVYFKFAELGTGVATQGHLRRTRPPACHCPDQLATRLSLEVVGEALATAASAPRITQRGIPGFVALNHQLIADFRPALNDGVSR